MDSCVPTHSSAGDAFIATRGNDVRRAEFEREILARLVPTHGDDAGGAHLLRRKHAHETDRAIANDHGRSARLHSCRIGGVPAGAKHVGCGEQARDQIVGRHVRRGDQRAVSERHPRIGRLRMAHELASLARRLEAETAMRAGVVGEAE